MLPSCWITSQYDGSKNQYERKFKDWGFRRNLSAGEWEYVFQKKRKRDDLGKESQVLLNAMLIPADRIKKQQGRYKAMELERIYRAGNLPYDLASTNLLTSCSLGRAFPTGNYRCYSNCRAADPFQKVHTS